MNLWREVGVPVNMQVPKNISPIEFYFYSNACHVCRKYGKDTALKRCANCMMIAYCSREHQREHWPAHKSLCKCLGPEIKDIGIIFKPKENRKWASGDVDDNSWSTLKKNILLRIQLQLGRSLLRFEQDMILFQRSCLVCHDTDYRKLVDCPNCPATSFCLDHANTEHEEICKLNRLCFELNVNSHEPLDDVPLVNIGTDIPIDIQGIMKKYHVLHDEKKTKLPLHIWTIHMASCLSRPYTLLYALQQLSNPKSFLDIHILGADHVEIDTFHCWEILFHHQKGLKTLMITFIGPNLDCEDVVFAVALSQNCTTKDANLTVLTVNDFYHNFAISEGYTKPDFIVGFNSGLFECEFIDDTWLPTIKEIEKQKCPFVLTSYTLKESQLDHEKIDTVLEKRVKFVHFGKNPYRCLRPDRDHETEHFYYENQYLTIYKQL